MSEQERNDRHKLRMQRKKAVVDERVKQATEVRGVIQLITGNGKGKSSSAFGTLARAIGHGQKVGVTQFIKGKWQSGEEILFGNHPAVTFRVMGSGFTWNTQDREQDKRAAQQAWEEAAVMLANPDLSLVVLDELTYMFKYDYLSLETVLTALRERPVQQHVIMTGRGAKPELVEIADTVSDIQDVKHAFRAGIKAQAGFDW